MTASGDTWKRREVIFHHLPPGQAQRALALLSDLPGLVVAHHDEHCLHLEYDVSEYALEDVENALSASGFHLGTTLLIRIKRALAYHCERVQRRNMVTPEPRTKNYKAFVEAWEHRPHGDHDETPEEWRQYK